MTSDAGFSCVANKINDMGLFKQNKNNLNWNMKQLL